ncbi:hypothetical protein AMS68_004557 [Peltaster fructicola]|uniref:Acyltransferase 3 domain-containing protein n=1 Tax=Peltaster fructicola TaxID=286661 RepID=A0A6H0XX89_9PEZI|nr:hypothetical protein AMS68_004557 [Peltaster fructicola]
MAAQNGNISKEEQEKLIGSETGFSGRDENWSRDIIENIPTVNSILGGISKSVPPPSAFSPRKMTLRNMYSWPPPDSSRDTAWLDGLRGVAAFFVMTYHFTLDWWFALYVEAPYGSLETVSQERHWFDFWRLPLLRIPFASGHTQVSVFFVLSGFVLSWGSLGLIRARRADKLANNLGSAVFRRWLRLYLPCFAIAFFQFLELRSGWRGITNKERMPSFWAQLSDFIFSCNSYAEPFVLDRNNWNSLHGYDWTMWTIPYEFAGSLCVFLVVLACARIQSYRKRSFVIGFLSLYAFWEAKWSYQLFLSGVWIADHVRELGGFEAIARNSNSTTRMRWFLVLIVGLLLAGNPEPSEAYSRPGYAWLDKLVTFQWYLIEGGGRLWWNWAGILIILSCCHLPGIQKLFSTRICRYLGRISFMIYITHRIILNGIGTHIKRFIFDLFGRGPYIDVPRVPGIWHPIITLCIFIILWAIHLPMVILFANWAEILIDAPSTRFAKWVDEQFVGGTQERPSAEPVLPTNESNGKPIA